MFIPLIGTSGLKKLKPFSSHILTGKAVCACLNACGPEIGRDVKESRIKNRTNRGAQERASENPFLP